MKGSMAMRRKFTEGAEEGRQTRVLATQILKQEGKVGGPLDLKSNNCVSYASVLLQQSNKYLKVPLSPRCGIERSLSPFFLRDH